MEQRKMEESQNETLVVEIYRQLDDQHAEFLFKSQCMKSQIYICKRLQEKAKHQEELSESLERENMKLQTEIALADEDIKSALKALKSIKEANVQKNINNLTTHVEERINNGIKKYEALWQASEEKYRSIPIIHYSLVVKQKKEAIRESLNNLIKEENQLKHEIIELKKEEFEISKKRIIQMANYFVHERPKLLRQIRDKQNELNELRRESEKLSTRFGSSRILKYGSRIEQVVPNKCDSKEVKDSWQSLSKDVKNDNAMLPPLLQFNTQSINTFSHRSDALLKQLKRNDAQNAPVKVFDTKDTYKEHLQSVKPYEIDKNVYISILLNKYGTKKSDDYKVDQNNKSIRILQDVKLDDAQAYEVLSTAKGNSLQKVNMIGEDARIDISKSLVKEKPVNTVEIKEILEVASNEEQEPEILLPPTQFKDQSYSQSSQPKRVTFDEGVSIRNFETMDLDRPVENDNIESQLNASVASELSYTKMKEVEFKTHNLDSTPPFIYSRNTIKTMKPENKIVTSKFFDYKNIAEENEDEKTDVNDDSDLKIKPMETDDEDRAVDENKLDADDKKYTDNTETTQMTQKNLTGFTFNHNEHGIANSLDISMDYDDSDGEMPSFINTSLLLSPKADDPEQSTDDPVPSTSGNGQKPQMFNFFSGFKNNRPSFFGASSAFKDKSEEQSKDEKKKFTFSFGGDMKKSSGFFNMFN